MRPLRVAHVIGSLIPGGAELQELALAERLPHDRFRIDFLAVAGPGEHDDRARAAAEPESSTSGSTKERASRC